MSKESIGFIGLGAMGVGMAANVIKNGYPLTVMGNKSREPIERLVGMGATEVKTPAEVAAASDIVILCVTTSEVVEQLVFGDNGLLAGAKKPFLLIDCGTSQPTSTKRIGAAMIEAGGGMLDVPLGRTPDAAESGTLNMMAGGSEEDFNKAKPLLETMSENLFHLGPLGTGHTIKLLNNSMSLSVAALTAEIVGTAKAAGIDLKQLHQVMSAGPNRSDIFDWVMASPLEGDEGKMAFSLSNGLKDIQYYLQFAKDVKGHNTIATATESLMAPVVANGHGNETIPALCRHVPDGAKSS